MKRITLILTPLLAACAMHQTPVPQTTDHTERLIVSYAPERKSDILTTVAQNGMSVVYDLKNMNIIVLSVRAVDADKEIIRLEKVPGVVGVQKDQIATIQ